MRGRLMRVITRITVSGPSTHVLVANRGLEHLGWETLLVHGAVEAGERELDLSRESLATQRIPSLRRELRPLDDGHAFAQLIRAIHRFRPDIVHTHHSKAGVLGRLAAFACRVPVRVHTFHGTVFEGYFGPRTSGAIIRVERTLARITDRLIVLGDAHRAELLRSDVGSPSKIVVIPLGTDLARFSAGPGDRRPARERLGIPANAFVLVSAGRFAPIKRFDRLIRVFARLHARLPATHLYLIGDGPLRADLEAEADALGLGDAVTFPGWSDRMPDWYTASDLVLNASDNEGTPLALIEAAGAGRPVVATRVGGVPDVVIDGETGYLIDRDDEPMFAERIAQLVENPARRAAMGAAATARAEARYGGDRLVDALDSLYGELLAPRDSRRRR